MNDKAFQRQYVHLLDALAEYVDQKNDDMLSAYLYGFLGAQWADQVRRGEWATIEDYHNQLRQRRRDAETG